MTALRRIVDDEVTCADCERLHPDCTCTPKRPSTSTAPMSRFVAVRPLPSTWSRVWTWLVRPMGRESVSFFDSLEDSFAAWVLAAKVRRDNARGRCDHVVDLERGRCHCGHFVVNTAPSVVQRDESARDYIRKTTVGEITAVLVVDVDGRCTVDGKTWCNGDPCTCGKHRSSG